MHSEHGKGGGYLKISVPVYIAKVLSLLNSRGYEAYVVGGSIRDSILGNNPDDWDVATDATPDETKQVFANYKIIETGIKHGTVMVIVDDKPVEITTYRIDGEYSDNRRPDFVTFTNKLELDLSRRDFTVNAMAFSPLTGLVDKFGSLSDIKNRIIRTVGDPDKRFSEDGLRIMRALRFACTLGFDIETHTAESIHANRELLKGIAAERLFSELLKLITGKDAQRILLEYGDVICILIPQLSDTVSGGEWGHICCSLGNTEPKKEQRLAVLLTGLCNEQAENVLISLKADKKTVSAVSRLVLLKDTDIPGTLIEVKRLLKRISPQELRQLLVIKAAESADSDEFAQISVKCERAEEYINQICTQNMCYSQECLAVNGRDISALGYSGADIGIKLNELLDAVIDERCKNTREELLKLLKKQSS